jgi:sec-independent protein translocase protein TatC
MAEENAELEEGLQMSFLDHLDELRKRLIHSLSAIAIAFAVCFYFADRIYDFLEVPVLREMEKMERAREAKNFGPNTIEHLKEGDIVPYTFLQSAMLGGSPVPAGTSVVIKVISRDNKLTAVLKDNNLLGQTLIAQGTDLPWIMDKSKSPTEGMSFKQRLVIDSVAGGFTLSMRVALYAAIAFAIPFLLYQIWAFISPGLYQHEKKYIVPVLVMGSFLFIGGAAFGYYVAFPAACNYLLGLHEGFQSLIKADDYLDLILMIMLGLGVIFQIPTISFILGRIGLVTAGMLAGAWRYAIVIIFIVAAVITPTADVFNLMIFAVPMMALYFLSIGIVWIFGKPRRSDAEVAAWES